MEYTYCEDGIGSTRILSLSRRALGHYTVGKFEDNKFRTIISAEDISKIREVVSGVDIQAEKLIDIVDNDYHKIASDAITNITVISADNSKYGDGIVNTTSNTGYLGVNLLRHKNNCKGKVYESFKLRLRFNVNGAEVTKTVTIGNVYSLKNALRTLVQIRCDFLNIEMPEDIDYTKALAHAKNIGYEENSSELDKKPLLQTYNIAKRKIYHRDSLKKSISCDYSDTGYSNIRLSFHKTKNGEFRVYVRLIINRAGVKVDKSLSLVTIGGYKSVLRELVDLKCKLLDIKPPKTIDTSKGLRSIRKQIKKGS